MKARRVPQTQGKQWWPRRKVLFFPELQLSGGFVLLEERAKLWRSFKQANPLFIVQRDGKAPEAVHADAPFFADTKFERAGAASASLFFHFRDFCFEFFIGWLGHGASCSGWNRGRIIQCVSICRGAVKNNRGSSIGSVRSIGLRSNGAKIMTMPRDLLAQLK